MGSFKSVSFFFLVKNKKKKSLIVVGACNIPAALYLLYLMQRITENNL